MLAKIQQFPKYLVMMNGYTACLKTYTARRLSSLLHIPLVETNKLGRCTDETGLLDLAARTRRYERAKQIVSDHLAFGSSIIVDGTFGLRDWRYPFYRECVLTETKIVVIVRCVCNDEKIIQVRLDDRKNNRHRPENEASIIENYRQTREYEQHPCNDTFTGVNQLGLIEFDTANYSVIVTYPDKFGLANTISDLIWQSIHTGRLGEN